MLPFLRPKVHDGWMAVAWVEGRFDLAHVHRVPGRKPEVTLLHSCPRSGEDDYTLRSLRKELGLGHYRCTALLDDGEYQMLQVEPPQVPAEELRDALRWHIKDALSYPAASANLDLLEIPAQPGSNARRRQVWAIAADRTLLAHRASSFAQAGLQLAAIDIPELAQRNIAALFEEEGLGLALLSFDAAGGMLSFTHGGELYALRRIDTPMGQLAGAEATQREALFGHIALEAQRSLDNFDRQFGHINVRRLLVTPLPESFAFVQYLREFLSVSVDELDLAEVLDFPALPELALPLQQTRYLKVIGAALRDAAN